MSNLSGAELDLAVARVMGLRAVITLWPPPCPPPDKYANKRSPACFLPDEDGRMFRPSRGAAAWEVLEWVMARYDEIWLAWADLNDQRAGRACGITIDQDRQVRGSGPTDAIALCRAVVALGEAG